jgi:hypothetical protein
MPDQSKLLGIFWARAKEKTSKMLIYNQNNITTPGIDIAGVASSILATPTIFP